MVTVAQLEYSVDTTQARRGGDDLDDLTTSTLNADAATKRLGQSSVTTGRNVARSAGFASNLNRALAGNSAQLRNVSLQLNQIAQQTLVTGNFLQAASIQAPDIFAAFGPAAILIGTATAALTPLALTFLTGADNAEQLADAMDEVNNLSSSLRGTLGLLRSDTESLVETYGAAASRVRQFGVDLAQLQIAQASSQLNDLAFSLGVVSEAFQNVLRDTRENVFTNVALRDALGVTQDQLIGIAEAFRDVDQAVGLENQQQALRNLLDTLQASNVEVSKLPPELQDVVIELLQVSNEADRAAESMRQLSAEAAGVNVGVPLFNQGFSDLTPQSEELSRRSGRGGARRDPYENNLNRLVESLQSERETLELWYEESEQLLLDHRARQFLTEEEHKAALLALEEEYAARKQVLDDRVAQNEVSAKQRAVSAVTSLLGTLGGESRAAAIALIAINKASSIAQAIQNTAVAQVRALAELGPIAGPPAAARIAAFGRVQIAAIAATGLAQAASIGGGDAGGSATGAGGVTATDATGVSEQRRILVDFNGAPSWVEALFADLTARIQENSDLGVIYEVARR